MAISDSQQYHLNLHLINKKENNVFLDLNFTIVIICICFHAAVEKPKSH